MVTTNDQGSPVNHPSTRARWTLIQIIVYTRLRDRARWRNTRQERDVGFSTEEAENLRIRGELMIEVAQSIEARKLTQPRVSDLVRGQIDLFSIDGLVNMLARLGVGIRLVVTRPRRAA